MDRVLGFHDGVVKEVHWVNNDYVGPELNLLPCKGSKARVLVQRQFRYPSAVELVLHGVRRIHLDAVDFVYDSAVRQEGSFLKLLVEECEFTFERMTYRFASELMGPDVRFGAEFGEPYYTFHNES